MKRKKGARRGRGYVATTRAEKTYACMTGCGNKCDGTAFNIQQPICRACFEEFVAFCGFGPTDIFLKNDHLTAVILFLERKKNGGRIQAYAGPHPLSGIQRKSAVDIEAHRKRATHERYRLKYRRRSVPSSLRVQRMPDENSPNGTADGSRRDCGENGNTQMCVPWKNRFRKRGEVTDATQQNSGVPGLDVIDPALREKYFAKDALGISQFEDLDSEEGELFAPQEIGLEGSSKRAEAGSGS
jgi:hypothetical protein